MFYPKISIITTTFNSEKTVEETILSVISQNYPNLEYIIVDGLSNDSTLNIVHKYKDEISIIVSEKDYGISDAFNKGIVLATGEIIGILNSDDVMLEGTLNAIAENYESNIDVYSMNVIIWNDQNNLKLREIPDMKLKLGSYSRHIAHQGRYVSKRAYDKWGTFDVRLRYSMDADLLIRLYKAKAEFKYINHDSALFRLGATTADDLFKKKNDRKLLVKNNGGGYWAFYQEWTFLLFRNIVKKIFNALLGTDFKRKLRYFKID